MYQTVVGSGTALDWAKPFDLQYARGHHTQPILA
jgi:hypothetical protein